MNTGRLIGFILIGAAVVVCLLGSALVLPRLAAGGAERLTAAAVVLGLAITAIIALPLAAGGVFMIVRGRQEAQTTEVAQKQRRLLDMVTSRGQVAITDAAVELQAPRDEVRNWVYRLVGLGVFTGYINWDDGVLYSAQAASLRELTNCKKCGGKLQLAGKGVVKCPYCGTEYFL
jgi:multisubunit Na+/H+ antiporter MnhC subunit